MIALTVLVWLSHSSSFPSFDVWKRRSPLTGAVPVTSVRDGAITLSDSRTFRPAGVQRAAGVTPEQFDAAVRTATAQGVVVTRDLGDGRAVFTVEPKFYNWCGTRTGWTRWAGSYYQAPLSETLVVTGYASAQSDQPGLSARERWRLDGLALLQLPENGPWRISEATGSFRFDSAANVLSDLDAYVAALVAPPP